MGVTRLAKLKKATEDNPENLDAWFELGKYATDRFIVGIGEEALSKVAQERQDDATVLGLLAKALNRKRQFVEAEKIYLRALDFEPENPELITGLAVVYGNQGELEKTLPFYDRVFALNKGYPWAVHGFVHLLQMLGRDNEIMPILEEALKANPNSALINVLYGIELQKRNDQSLGKKHLEKGLGLIDKVDCEEQSRALRLLLESDPGAVIKYGNRILQEDPDNMDIELFVNLARSNTEPQATVIELKKMLERDPNSPRIMGMLLKVLFQVGDMAGIMEYKERLETIAPEDGLTSVVNMILTRSQPGGLLVSKQTRETYVESARDILRRFPVSSHANLTYIQALISNNQFDEAKAQSIKVNNEIEMDDIRQHLTFARILHNLGLWEESKAQYKAASDITNSPYEKLLVQLTEYTENENYPELVKACSEFIDTNPATPEIYAILGRVQHYTNHDDAKINLEIAAEAGNHDAKILLSSLLSKEGDEHKADQILEQMIGSKDIDNVTMARCLIGLKQFDEASGILKKHLDEMPGDYLGWYLLALINRREGESAVKKIMKKMLESGVREIKKDGSDEFSQIVEIDEGVKELTRSVMVGDIGGSVKHLILSKQVMALLITELEEEM